MSFHYSPKTITDNLILYLDSANYKSYVSGSTVWNDLSIKEHVTTLINSPTFDTSNMGCLLFDGVDDYGTIPYNPNFNLSGTNYTFEAWFNPTSFAPQLLISKDTNGANFDWCIYLPNSTSITIFSNGTATNVTATVPTMVANEWYHIVITSISGVIRIYLNSVLYNTQSMNTSNSSQVFVTVGCASWNSPNGLTHGKLPILKLYRKGLTSSEILQNYNALKPRFQ